VTEFLAAQNPHAGLSPGRLTALRVFPEPELRIESKVFCGNESLGAMTLHPIEDELSRHRAVRVSYLELVAGFDLLTCLLAGQ
jgi:hypothetical protein